VLGSEAEACRRDSPAPFQPTRNINNLGAPARSLQYLFNSAKELQDMLQRGFALGTKIAQFDLKTSPEDYKITLKRIAMSAKWNDDLTSGWQKKGRDACGDLLMEAEVVLKDQGA
jgi:hypothetical protein